MTYGTYRVAFALRWVQGLKRRGDGRRRRNGRRDRRAERGHVLVDRTAELLGQETRGFEESGISNMVCSRWCNERWSRRNFTYSESPRDCR